MVSTNLLSSCLPCFSNFCRIRWLDKWCGVTTITYCSSRYGNERHERRRNRCQSTPTECLGLTRWKWCRGQMRLAVFFVARPTGKPLLVRRRSGMWGESVADYLRSLPGRNVLPPQLASTIRDAEWADLGLRRNPQRDEEVEWQRKLIFRAPLVVRDIEYPFPEEVILDNSDTVHVSLQFLRKCRLCLRFFV